MTMASYSYSFHHAAILGWYEEFSHRISLVHNFVNILPLSTIVAFPCSLLRSLSATETLARWELWGRRYCYWRQRQAAGGSGHGSTFDDDVCCVLCEGYDVFVQLPATSSLLSLKSSVPIPQYVESAT